MKGPVLRIERHCKSPSGQNPEEMFEDHQNTDKEEHWGPCSMEGNDGMKLLEQMTPEGGNIFRTEVPKRRKYDPKFQPPSGLNPAHSIHSSIVNEQLLLAAKTGNVEDVRWLLGEGADVESKDYDGWKPLSWAAERGHLEIIKFLVQEGSAVESKDRWGQTPLSCAAYYGQLDVVNFW